ncbi:hypothetical protein ACE1CI_22945 [Aerosakkonemataceae cyanobacterium BLCC-F50]|uniref:Uncharacterized protein n=1 Tax=Floridaenema flaviceps BLCC-F50 TaxID=3153642 RepID=A0ABV4XW70_9CYAN
MMNLSKPICSTGIPKSIWADFWICDRDRLAWSGVFAVRRVGLEGTLIAESFIDTPTAKEKV